MFGKRNLFKVFYAPDIDGIPEDDFMPSDDTTENAGVDDSLSMPPMDEEEKKEDEKKDEDTSNKEETPEEKEEDSKDKEIESTDEKSESEEDEDDLDLAEMFKDLEKENQISDDIIQKAEENGGQLSPEEIKNLKESNNAQQSIIEKLMSEKTDLMFKNAELEAFGGKFSTPELLILSRHIPNVDSNPQSKEKVIATLKSMYEDLVGKDINQEKIDKDADIISASEAYNSSVNPDFKSQSKDSDDFTMVM